MFEKKRYNEILFMIDTCQANTMYSQFASPNVIGIGSSKKGENSYSHHLDEEIGVAVIDRFTNYNLEFLESLDKASNATLQNLINSWDVSTIHSNPGVRVDLFDRDLSSVRIMDFFGNVQEIRPSDSDVKFNNEKVTQDILDIYVNHKDLEIEDSPISSRLTQDEPRRIYTF
jgi:phosphatidylinositol glycan class K